MRRMDEIVDGMGAPRLRGVPDPYRGGRMTRQGWFSDEDLGQAQAKVLADGTVIFPIGYRNVGFDEATGRVRQEPIYPPLGRENAAARQEIAEHDGHTFEIRRERYASDRREFERQRASRHGPRRGE